MHCSFLNSRDSLCIARFVLIVLFTQLVVAALSGQGASSTVLPLQAVLHENLNPRFVVPHSAVVTPSGVSLQSWQGIHQYVHLSRG
jgi:hypothetical protein